MNFALVKKCINEAKYLFLACFAALFAFCVVRVWLVSQIDTSKFQRIIELLPGEWQKFSTVSLEQLVQYEGRISLTYDEPVVVFCMTVWCIARGSDVISGEINRGSMEMLLSQPVSRLNVLFTHAAVTVAGVLCLAVATWLGVFTGIQIFSVNVEQQPEMWLPLIGPVMNPFGETIKTVRPLRELVNPLVFMPAAVNLASMGFMLAGLTTLLSSFDRYRWRTIGLMIGFYVISVLTKMLGLANETFGFLIYTSVFTPYEPEICVQLATVDPSLAWGLGRYNEMGEYVGVGPLGCHLILLGIGVAAYTAAAVIFTRRDLPAPL